MNFKIFNFDRNTIQEDLAAVLNTEAKSEIKMDFHNLL